MNIFVGNLHARTTSSHLFSLFVCFGKVISSKIAMDSSTGQSLGFGFIEMDDKAGAVAIKSLHNRHFMNTFLEVNELSV